MMETFDYKGTLLKRAKALERGGCRGCYFNVTGISCIHKNVPECGNDIFVLAEPKE